MLYIRTFSYDNDILCKHKIPQSGESKLIIVAFKAFCDLIGAAGGFHTAADTLEAGNSIIDAHTFEKGRNTLEIAVTSSDDIYAVDNTVVDVEYELSGADASGIEDIFHIFTS